MKALLPALGLTLLAIFPIAAQAAVTTWNVSDASFNVTVNPEDYLIDTQGVYGQVGRKLLLSDLQGRFDPSGPARLKLENGLQPNPAALYYDVYATYTLAYTLRDFETREQVASEKAILRIGSWSEATAGPPTGSFSGSLGGLTIGGASIVDGLDFTGPDFRARYTAFTASGDFPGDFRLDYQGSGLYVQLSNGLQHRPFAPGAPDHPAAYFFNGYLTLTPAIPEPETYALMAMGLAGVAVSRRLKRRLPA